MDREKGFYKFCYVDGVGEGKCPGVSVKTPMESRSEDKNNNLIGNVVDVVMGMANTENEGPVLNLSFIFASTKMYQESLEKLKMNVKE